MPKKNKAFGTWPSKLTADLILEKSISVVEILVDPVTHGVYHVEGRPSEGGRQVIMSTREDRDVVSKDWNSRTTVHEYGGMSVACRAEQMYFSDFASKRVHRVDAKEGPVPVTPDNPNYRYGDFDIHPQHYHRVLAILEDHTKSEPADVVNKLVLINARTQTFDVIAEGADFYSSAKFSPDGKKIFWLQWFHPDMPWEGSELVVADFSINIEGESFSGVTNERVVAGKRETESITQPRWLTRDSIIFLSDVSGFYNPWVYNLTESKGTAALSSPLDQDFAEPAWLLGASRMTVLDSKRVIVCPIKDGASYLAVLDLDKGTVEQISTPYQTVSCIHAYDSTHVVFTGVSDREAPVIGQLTVFPTTVYKTLKRTSTLAANLPDGSIARAIPHQLGTHDSPLYVTVYSPLSPEYRGFDGTRPPAIINAHGGPTSRAAPGLSWTIQYFTSRGWAWIDVDYGGSSGYGRAYRERLRGKWGVVDVEDCVAAVKALGQRNIIDVNKTAIRGGSAGGYTVLQALTTHANVFHVGTSLYGISDLLKLAEDTHKFESRYLEKLLGGTPEEVPDVYRERSPLHHAENIATPLLILQGSIDPVVPPNQAEAIIQKIKDKDGKVEYILFDGEGHGWKKAESIKRALESELAFYEVMLGLHS